MYNTNNLNLDRGWSITEASFSYISALIQERNYVLMTEFGSGISTVRWALEFPTLGIASYEHSLESYQQVSELINDLNLNANIELYHTPLRYLLIGMRLYKSYSIPKSDRPTDIVIIDGPPHYTLQGREACIHSIYNNLRIGGCVILDDLSRDTEKKIVQNWMFDYPDSFDFQHVTIGNGLGILTKVSHVKKKYICTDSIKHNYKEIARQILFYLKRNTKQLIETIW